MLREGVERKIPITPNEIIGPLNLELTVDSYQFTEATWKRLGSVYRTVMEIGKHLVGVGVQKFDSVEKPRLEGTMLCPQEFEQTRLVKERVFHEFALGDDLIAVYEVMKQDPVARTLLHAYRGLRLVRYADPEECLLVYQLSTNTTIERLEEIVACLKAMCGKRFNFPDGLTSFTYPTLQQVSRLPLKTLNGCKLGYKALNLLQLAKVLQSQPIDWAELGQMKTAEASEGLKRFPGVGDKVADAVLLYALRRWDTCAIDVWVRRALIRLYNLNPSLTYEGLKNFLRERFGTVAGTLRPTPFTTQGLVKSCVKGLGNRV